MDSSILFIIFYFIWIPSSSSSTLSKLREGSSMSVEKPNNVLVSPNGVFSAGFHPVGDNAFCFAIWFTKSIGPTVIWMPNRDQPVNGKGSKLSLTKDGNLILRDADQITIWTTSTTSDSFVQLHLHDTGNLVLSTLHGDANYTILWQSFDSPTNTLLPQQPFTRHTTLVSSRSQNNYSSGYYKLLFSDNNVLSLLYDSPEVSGIYWPEPWLMVWDTGRTSYNNTKIAMFDSSGYFQSSDSWKFLSVDYGFGPQRRLTLDIDGNLRLYSLDEIAGNWTVTWLAMSDPCGVQGLCGANGMCSHGSGASRGCSCLPGYKMKNLKDWSYGCELEFNDSRNNNEVTFLSMSYVELFGYEYQFVNNSNLDNCKKKCSESSICKGFLFKFEEGTYNCYMKSLLLNAKHSPNLIGTLYVKLSVSGNRSFASNEPVEQIKLNCSGEDWVLLSRTYKRKKQSKFLNFLVWFACGFGVIEMLCVFLFSWLMFWNTHKDPNAIRQGYILAATRFRKFTYAELKKATKGFSEEIGRGGGGVVYKGVLCDGQVVAIKQLNEGNQGEEEFLAEVSTIGRLNHMNLIEILGYCVQKHKILVYEYMEHGSLAENLNSNTLDWEKRFEIAIGTARGLAYLHEECLEWVLHCDVKPQNILLDSNYNPKVADFGLSKLLNRGGIDNSNFSRIRGTTGYMAPEWVFNLPITSKVDVYSYGIVMLEMATGRGLTWVQPGDEHTGLVTWVREKRRVAAGNASWVDDIIDPTMKHDCDAGKMAILIDVALQCVEEDKNGRPTMRQVVEMLLRHEDCYEMIQ